MINTWFYYQLFYPLYDVKVDNKNYKNEYIKMFWVGLMDGDGSIQVNHWQMRSLQYRLLIKLSNIESNFNMLISIAKTIGGTVRIVNNSKEVIWVVDRKETITSIISIFAVYPPLTSRLTCQLKFLKLCLKDNSVKNYLNNRKLKYDDQTSVIKKLNIDNILLPYFPSWLSGFIEAEGCFSIRKNKSYSFSIGQNDDFYILDSIKKFFGLTAMVRNPHSKLFLIESYNKESLQRIIKHCNNYPLLGGKSLSLDKLIKHIS